MLRSLLIENFRGIERLEVENLGRVNLFIGGNDSGKTSVLAAAALATCEVHPAFVAHMLCGGAAEYPARSPRERVGLLSRAGDEERGFFLRGAFSDGDSRVAGGRLQPLGDPARPGAMELRILTTQKGTRAATPNEGSWVPLDAVVAMDAHASALADWERGVTWWVAAQGRVEEDDVQAFEALFRRGLDAEVTVALQRFAPHVDELSVGGFDVLVRFVGSRFRLPIAVLGDGARRAFILALALTAPAVHQVYFDEIDDGMHFSALEKIWSLVRDTGTTRQVFATTHSEACLRAAVDAFQSKPEELRIIRTTRDGDQHRVAVYDWEAANAALEAGWEIRG